MTDKEAMKLALEALELLTGAWQTFDALDYGDNAIAALKERLAEHAMRETQRLGQEIEQKPVQFKCTVIDDAHPNGIPLEQWASPPQRTEPVTDDIASILACRNMLDAQPVPPRTWVGSGDIENSNAYLTPPQSKPLTDDELSDIWYKQSTDWMEFARAIEAAHGIKEIT